MLFVLLLAATTAAAALSHLRSDLRQFDQPSNGVGVNDNEIHKIINGIGGYEVLEKVERFEYSAETIYRSTTLMQSYNLYSSDQSVASSGFQTMQFETNSTGLFLRIDRAYEYNEYWIWAFPDLLPTVDMSLVIHDTANASACFVKGQNNFFSPNLTAAQGYADSFLADYLIHQARQFAIPWLLLKFRSHVDQLRRYTVWDPSSHAAFLMIEHPVLGLALMITPETYHVHAIRSTEHHSLYGPSTSDLVLTKWQKVPVTSNASLLLPHRFQTIYNSRYVLEDFLVDTIRINTAYEPSLFSDRKPEGYLNDSSQTSGLTPSAPTQSSEYPRSEVHEFFESGLWGGPFGEFFNVSDVVISYPDLEFRNIMQIYVGYCDYVQLLIEHAAGFIITDAPAHRSKIILEWLAIHRPDKHITHVVPSHHHRDHAGGIGDYLEAGATLVVPEVAKDFYNRVKGKSKVALYNDRKPFVFSDGLVDFRSYWKNNSPHAEDWSFAVAAKANATNHDTFVLFNADVVSPGTDALRWDLGAARAFLAHAVRIGVPRSALLVGAHGSSHNGTSTTEWLAQVADTAGFAYPKLMAKDWSA